MLLAIRLPFLLNEGLLQAAELKWLLLGQKMGEGNLLYADIWDNTAPLAAGVYWLLDVLFGRSAMAHHVVSLLLVWVQGTTQKLKR